MITKYRVLTKSTISQAQVGDIVYKFAGYDYGLARADTQITGVKHICLTLDSTGAGPFFTHPLDGLELVTEE